VFAWPNIQVASFATPPVLAVGTQTGNIASLTGLGSLTSGVSGLAVLNVSDPGSSGLALFSLDDGTANNQLALTYSAGRLVLSLLSGGVSQAAVDIGEWRIGRYAVAFSAGPNYVNGQVVRGDTATADTVATYPSISAVGLGGLTGTSTGRASVLVEKLGLKYGAGSTQAFASAYSSAVLAHGAVPALWDNFDRADGAIGTAASGQTWQQISGFVSASISSKALVALDSGGATTAAYNTIDLGSAPSSMKSRIFFGAGTTGGGVAMIAMPTYQSNSNTPITTSSIHIVFANDHVDIGIWQSAVYTVVKTITYPVAMKQDGTIYEVSWSISGNTLTVAVPGIIAPYSVTDSRFVTLTGRYVTFEHFWNSGQCHPSFTYVEARP
jgi:hypothetical protein